MLLLKKGVAYGLLLTLLALMWGCIGKCKYDLLLSAGGVKLTGRVK